MPGFLFNIGLDLSVWVWAVAAVLACGVLAVVAYYAKQLVQVLLSKADHNTYPYRKARKRAVWKAALSLMFSILIILGLFGAYGEGSPIEMEDGRGEAIHQNAGPPPTRQQLEEDYQKKVDPELKKQKKHHKRVEDPSDKKERDDADRYEKKALDRSRR